MRKVMKHWIALLALALPVQAWAQTETLQVWMDDITLTADGETASTLTVYEHDDNADYTAFSMALIVPKGVQIQQVKNGRRWVNNINLTERADETHSITANMLDGDSILIFADSSENLDFYNTDLNDDPLDAIFTIGLIADPTMINGDYEIRISICKFVLGNSKASQPQSPVKAIMTITGGQDGLTVPLNISSAGISTLVLPFDADLPDGLSAWTCTSVSGNSIETEQQTRLEAGIPVVVTGAPGNYEFRGVPTITETECTAGLLTGVFTDKQITSGYVLQMLNGKAAFYQVNPERPITVPAYKCYMSTPSEVHGFNLYFDEATDIGAMIMEDESEFVYDLQGRRLRTVISSDGKLPKGVYIRDGKKELINK